MASAVLSQKGNDGEISVSRHLRIRMLPFALKTDNASPQKQSQWQQGLNSFSMYMLRATFKPS